MTGGNRSGYCRVWLFRPHLYIIGRRKSDGKQGWAKTFWGAKREMCEKIRKTFWGIYAYCRIFARKSGLLRKIYSTFAIGNRHCRVQCPYTCPRWVPLVGKGRDNPMKIQFLFHFNALSMKKSLQILATAALLAAGSMTASAERYYETVGDGVTADNIQPGVQYAFQGG